LLGIFPRGEVGAPIRAQLAEVNVALARLDDGKHIRFLDLGASFLERDGMISRAVMPDLLHPSERGYEIWAKAMEGTMAELLAKP
jgi:beta-glucosidase